MDHSTMFLQQQLSDFLIVGGILAYGIRQYIKREKAHKALIRSLLAGEGAVQVSPVDETKPALWRLLTITAFEILLLAGIVWLVSIRNKILYGGDFTYIIALSFLVLFTFLLSILIRDIKVYRSSKGL